MRYAQRSLIISILFLFLCSPAMADEILYTLTGNLGDVISFHLPSLTPAPLPCSAHPPDCFAQGPATVNVNGTLISGLEVDFTGPSEFGGFTIDVPGGFPTTEYVNTFGPVLFSGTLANPVFSLGTFNLQTDNCCGALYLDSKWTLVATSVPSSVPEPETFLLLGSGLVGLGVTVRNKLVRMNSKRQPNT